MRPMPAGITAYAIVAATTPGGANEYREMANYADHSQVVDVSYIHDAPHPVFAPERRPPAMLRMVCEQRETFRQAVKLCEVEGLGGTLNIPDDNLRAMVLELYKSLCAQKLLLALYESMHAEEEAEQMRLLKKLA